MRTRRRCSTTTGAAASSRRSNWSCPPCWRGALKPKVEPVVAALSGWALPRGSDVEVNRDEYVRPGPLERAQTWQILVELGVLTTADVQRIERFTMSGQAVGVPV